jgi:hypothetical protein
MKDLTDLVYPRLLLPGENQKTEGFKKSTQYSGILSENTIKLLELIDNIFQDIDWYVYFKKDQAENNKQLEAEIVQAQSMLSEPSKRTKNHSAFYNLFTFFSFPASTANIEKQAIVFLCKVLSILQSNSTKYIDIDSIQILSTRWSQEIQSWYTSHHDNDIIKAACIVDTQIHTIVQNI